MSRPKTSTILIAFGLFLFFLVLEFPYQNLRGYIFGKIYTATHIFISADELSLSIFGWPGLKLRNVSVSVPMAYGNDLEIASEKTVVRAGIGGLFPPYPVVSLSLDKLKKGGDLWVKVGQTSSFVKGALDAEKVSLEQFPIPGMSDTLTGKVQADGDFYYNKNELSKSTGDININITEFRIPPQNLQGIVLPALMIGNIKGKLQVRNGSLEISNFQLGTPTSDIRGTMTGELRLGKDLMSSYLALTLKLQLSDKYRQDPNSATLVSFLQSFQTNTPGDYALKWGATLQEMSTNIVAALPQKAS